MVGTIKGTPTSCDEVVLCSGDLVNPDLTDLAETVPAADRYSYSFDGNAQVLDHELVTQNLLTRLHGLHYARNDADFPESFRNDPNRPERISDHDMPVAYFSFAPLTLFTSKDSQLRGGAPNTNEGANLLALQSSGPIRSVAQFDLTGVSTVGLTRATLVLTIASNSSNWGSTGRTVDAHLLAQDWTEGNGNSAAGSSGSGPGVTWNCATDPFIESAGKKLLRLRGTAEAVSRRRRRRAP